MKRVTDYEQIREYFLDAIVCHCCGSFRGIFELRYSKAGKVPLFDVRLLKNRNLRNGTLVRLITSFVMAGTLFALSVFLLSVLKLSAFETGLMLMPMTVGMMLVSFIAPKMAMKIGHKYTMILGFVIAIGGCLAMRNRFTPDTGFMSLFPCLLIYGVGLGFPSSLSVDVPLSTVPPQAQNSCSGLVSTGQNLGLSIFVWLNRFIEPLAESAYKDIFINYTGLFIIVSAIAIIKSRIRKRKTHNR